MSEMFAVTGRLAQILASGKHYDQKFNLRNGETVYGHKLIFAISSPVFEEILFNGIEGPFEVSIEDIDPQVFKIMVEFMYTDKLKIGSVSEAIPVYRAAKTYKFEDLKKMTEEFMLSNVKFYDVLMVYECSEFNSCSSVKNMCRQIMQDDTEKVLRDDQLLNCSVNFLELLVSVNRMNITEVELFKFIEKWFLNRVENGGEPVDSVLSSMSRVIKKMRFLSLGAGDFVTFPYRSQLLSAEDKHRILMNLSLPNCVPLPFGFCNYISPRSIVCCHYHNNLVDRSFSWLWACTRLGDGFSFNLSSFEGTNGYESNNQIVFQPTKAVVFEAMLSDGFQPSAMVTITGVILDVPDIKRFRVDFLCKNQNIMNLSRGIYSRRSSLHDDDINIAFHMNVKFDYETAVRNTKTNGAWHRGGEEDGAFVFTRGSTFILDIYCLDDGYQVFVNGYPYCCYLHRILPHSITHLAISGCVDVHSVIYYPDKVSQFTDPRRDNLRLVEARDINAFPNQFGNLSALRNDVIVRPAEEVDEDNHARQFHADDHIQYANDFLDDGVHNNEDHQFLNNMMIDNLEQEQRGLQMVRDVLMSNMRQSSEEFECVKRGIIYEIYLNDGFLPSSRMVFTGVVLDAPQRFRIDFLYYPNRPNHRNRRGIRRFLVHDDESNDVAFHFNPRFDEMTIVRNTKVGYAWNDHEERDGDFVFSRGNPFTIEIQCCNENYKVMVDGSLYCYYRHRTEPHEITHVVVGGCVDIHSAYYYSSKGSWYQFVKKNAGASNSHPQ